MRKGRSLISLLLVAVMLSTMSGVTFAADENDIQLLEAEGALENINQKELQKTDLVRMEDESFDKSSKDTIQATLDNGTDILVVGNDINGIKKKIGLEYDEMDNASTENVAAVNISESELGINLNIIYYCLYDSEGNPLSTEAEAELVPELVDFYGLEEKDIYNATNESEEAGLRYAEEQSNTALRYESIQSDSYGHTNTKTMWLWMSNSNVDSSKRNGNNGKNYKYVNVNTSKKVSNYTAIGGASETLYILKAAKDMPSGVTKDWNVCHFYFFEKNDYKIKDVKPAYRLEENNAKAVIEEVSDMSRKDDRIGLSFGNGNISSSYSFNPNELTIKDYTNDLPFKMHWSTDGNGKSDFKVQPTLLISAGKGTTQTYKAYMYLNHFYVKKGLHSYKISDIGDSNLWITVKPTSRKAATVYAGELM